MKKIFNQAVPLVLASVMFSALGEGWKLISSEMQFHRDVRADIGTLHADIAEIKTKLGIEPTKEKTTYATVNP